MKYTTTLLCATVALAGCSSSSGPTFDAYSVALPNHQQAYQVRCDGLFNSKSTCESKAREICGNAQVNPLQAIAPYSSGSDTRLLTFECAAAQPAQPVQQPVPAPIPVAAAMPRKITLSGDANFDFDAATLTPMARGKLDQLIADAHGMSFRTLKVDGYTDGVGTDSYNQGLSERRAQAVALYLRDHGLKAEQFVAHGYGKANPVASNETAAGRAENRRVEITLETVK